MSCIKHRRQIAVIGSAGLATITLVLLFLLPEETPLTAAVEEPLLRATTWPTADPRELGMDEGSLEKLADLVEGAGFVAHKGRAIFRWGYDHRPRYAASAKKSVISALNLQAVEQGLLSGVDEPVVKFEPRLAELNGGIDAGITWRHLGCMTSGYGATDTPGQAFSYNDFAVALWYDTLMDKVYREKGTEVLKRQLAGPLGFEDEVTFQAFGPQGPEPKLRISARDLARFGQMILDGGRAADGTRVLSEASLQTLLGSVVPVTLPISKGIAEPMIPGQKTVGGQMWNNSPIGPGRYSFHFWLNKRGPTNLMMLPEAPGDTILASGKWGETTLWIIPSLELVVAWNDSDIADHHLAREYPTAKMNEASRLIVQAVTGSPLKR